LFNPEIKNEEGILACNELEHKKKQMLNIIAMHGKDAFISQFWLVTGL